MTTTTDAWMVQIFEAIDSMQAEKFASYFAQESLFRFGNAETVRGPQAIKEANTTFFHSIAKLEHHITGIWHGKWEHGPVVSVEANVTYTRKDGTQTAPLPATSTIRIQADKIKEYRIFVDISPLFATS
jgi:hypothetical protein